MNSNDESKFSYENSSPDSRITHKLKNGRVKHKMMYTKSSMMGALGVVPEENDSDQAGEEARLKGRMFHFNRSTTTK